jgi:hypothetical protein
MIRAAMTAAFLIVAPPALAQPTDARIADLIEAPRLIALMREEGLAYGRTLAADLIGRPDDPVWAEALDAIYDEDAMLARFENALDEALTQEEGGPIAAFLDGDLGQRVVQLELAGREAIADPDAEDAARAVWAEVAAEGGPRAERIEAFIAANDLVEENVAAGLTANYEFLAGLAEGGGMLGAETTEDALIAQAYGAEPELRAETEAWLGGYLHLSYGPLSDAELDDYIAFSVSEAGRDMNRALFRAFEEMYDGMSRALGRAAGERMRGEDI